MANNPTTGLQRRFNKPMPGAHFSLCATTDSYRQKNLKREGVPDHFPHQQLLIAITQVLVLNNQSLETSNPYSVFNAQWLAFSAQYLNPIAQSINSIAQSVNFFTQSLHLIEQRPNSTAQPLI